MNKGTFIGICNRVSTEKKTGSYKDFYTKRHARAFFRGMSFSFSCTTNYIASYENEHFSFKMCKNSLKLHQNDTTFIPMVPRSG